MNQHHVALILSGNRVIAIDPRDDRSEEIRAAYQRIDRLESDLNECLEYFHDHSDVVDGDYGEPSPNKEMRLASMLDETLNGRLY
jgi:hypothetical protein